MFVTKKFPKLIKSKKNPIVLDIKKSFTTFDFW